RDILPRHGSVRLSSLTCVFCQAGKPDLKIHFRATAIIAFSEVALERPAGMSRIPWKTGHFRHFCRLLLALTVAGLLRNARVVQDLDGGRRAEVLPVLQHPDDLLAGRDFNQLGRIAAVPPRAKDGISVVQADTSLTAG